MSEVTVKKVAEIEAYKGEHAIPGMHFRPVGKNLGVTAWGMSVIEIDAGCTKYPEHDHVENGQEEVYYVLRGSGTLQAEGKETPVSEGTIVRVPPNQKRKFLPGPKGIALIAIGGTPGKAYPTPQKK